VQRRFGLQREGRRQEVWYPIYEEAETILQRTGTSVRSALAQEGVVDSSAEVQLGMVLLQDVETMIRATLSRVVRPAWAQSLSSGKTGGQPSEPLVVDSGEFAGWVIAAFRETQLGLGSLDAVKNRHTTCAGIVFDYCGVGYDDWPFAAGDPLTWSVEGWADDSAKQLDGAAVGHQYTRDAFGKIETFVPHPLLLTIGHLRPTEFYQGFTLVDPDGEPAIVCRNWRRGLIGTEYFEDFEHRTDGLAMLIRRDVFAIASSSAAYPARLVTVIQEEEP
jgi:hypothetical protein